MVILGERRWRRVLVALPQMKGEKVLSDIFKRRSPLVIIGFVILAVVIAVGVQNTVPSGDREDPAAVAENPAPELKDAKIYALELAQPLSSSQINQLKQKYNWTGETYDQAVLIRGEAALEQELAGLSFVQKVKEFTPAQKIVGELGTGTGNQGQQAKAPGPTEDVIIYLYGENDKPAVIALINQLGGQVVDGAQARDRYLQAVLPASALDQLAASAGVMLVEKSHQPELLNDRARDITGARPVAIPNFIAPGGLTGQGQTIGLADSGLDTGKINDLHPDFQTSPGKKPRIIMLKSWGGADQPGDIIGHGTHMAGTLVGSGQASGGKYAGVVPEASLYVQDIVNNRGEPSLPVNIATLYRPAYEASVRVHVNGWGRKTNSYNSTSSQIDDFIRNQPDFLAIFGSGNFGPGPGTITAEANSKNALVIGATASSRPALQTGDQAPGTVTDFSSRGPAADGRIKPELLAPGTAIVSTASRLVQSDHYNMLQGTSMASAVAGGAATQLRQYFAQQEGLTSPSAALLKAALINGALLPPGEQSPSLHGFGVLNSARTIISLKDKLVHFEDQGAGVKNGEFIEYNYTVADPDAPFKATLAWTDPSALPGAPRTLVNNLDLVVITPGGQRLYGNAGTQSGSRDTVNNVEQVYITKPTPGTYTIRVLGQSVVQNASRSGSAVAQDFALVYGQPALTAEVTDFNRSQARLTLATGDQFYTVSKNIYGLTNNMYYPGDSKQIKTGSQLYAGRENLYFVTRTWREHGLQLKKNETGWLWFKTDPRDLDGGYYSLADAGKNILVNGTKDPDLDLNQIPAGFEVLATVNPHTQLIRQAEITFARVEGFVQEMDQALGTIRLIGHDREYKLAPAAVCLYDDKIVGSDPVQTVFGPVAGDWEGQLNQGMPVSLMVAPSAMQVQSIAMKRTVAVGIIQEVDPQKQTLVLNDKTHRLLNGATLTRDGRTATLADIAPGQLATLVLIDARGDVTDLNAYTNHHLGQISYIQTSLQTIYLQTSDGTMHSLKLTPGTQIYRWGLESDLQSLAGGMWVRVIMDAQGQEIKRLDVADALEERDKLIEICQPEENLLTTRDGINYHLGAQSQVLFNGLHLPAHELKPGDSINQVVSLLNPRDNCRVVMQMEATVKPGQPEPQLRVSSIPFVEDYWIAGETTGNRLYLYHGNGEFERIPITPEGRFSLGYVPGDNQQYIDLIAVSDQNGVTGTRLNIEVKKQKTFTDIDGHWAGHDLRAIAREGLISGYPDGAYRPDQTVTRVEFYALLARAFGWYADLSGEQTFHDWHLVPGWAKQAVGGAMTQNIVTGYPDGTFGPLKPVTRVEQGAVLARIMGLYQLETGNPGGGPVPDFADAGEIPEWARESVHKVCAAGIMQGQDNNRFVPHAPATRAETAVTIYRLLQKVRASRI